MAVAYQRRIYTYITKFDTIAKKTTWGCQNCDYKVGKRRKTKIIGRIASAHGHTPRRKTAKWNISLNEKPPREKLKPTERDDANDPMLHIGRDAGRITYRKTSTRNYIMICNADD